MMGLLSWLNRTFRTNLLSAPSAAMAGGAEGVSVVHPIEADGAISEESAPDPVESEKAGEENAPSAEAAADVFSRYGRMAYDVRDAIARYGTPFDRTIPFDFDAEANTQSVRDVEASPIARLANTILQQAITERASHIHVEPDVRKMRIRYRIDGVLHEAMPMPKYLQLPLTNRYKVLAQIDMATHRGLPQEGRFSCAYQEVEYNVCVNSHSTRFGDYLTLHLHSSPRIQGEPDSLGMSPEMWNQVQWSLYQPCGLVLIVGPARSGSTTTQYALLNHLNTVGVHVVTAEERMTYTLPGLTQLVADTEGGQTLSGTVRAAQRQDADVVGIGDLRNKKVAHAALEAAASSLVIATMHGNEALSTLVRLAALGIEPALVAQTVQGVVTQRQVRKICPHCKETHEAAARELKRFGFNIEEAGSAVTLARGSGCSHCRHTGFLDCTGLFEMFHWDSTLRQMFSEREALPRLKQVFAWNRGSNALRDDGLKKVLAHVTTPEEVWRVLG